MKLKELLSKYPKDTTLEIDFGESGCLCTIEQFKQFNFKSALNKEVLEFKYYPPTKDYESIINGSLEVILKQE